MPARRDPAKPAPSTGEAGGDPPSSCRQDERHGRAGIYVLLCMFNSFAMPKPFCRPIKMILE
jgi:hypothetical protein